MNTLFRMTRWSCGKKMFKVSRNLLVNMANKFKVNDKDFCTYAAI